MGIALTPANMKSMSNLLANAIRAQQMKDLKPTSAQAFPVTTTYSGGRYALEEWEQSGTKKRTVQTVESNTLRAILDYLILKGYCPVRVNPTHIVQSQDGCKFAPVGKTQKGCADILVSMQGVAVAIEVKRPGGVQSEDQVAWQHRWETGNSKGVYLLVDNVDDVIRYESQVRKSKETK